MRWPDALVALTSIAIALAGHLVIQRLALVLDPDLCVALAWERADYGDPPRSRMPLDHAGRLIEDPWGFPFRWVPEPALWIQPMNPPPSPPWPRRISPSAPSPPAGTGWVLRPRRVFYAQSLPVSLGPDGVTSADDVPVKATYGWPRWQRFVVTWPRLVSLIAAAYLALAWTVLRAWRVRGARTDALYAALVVLPLAPVFWLAASTERAGELTLMRSVLVPAPVALTASAWALALLVAFGVRTRTRAATMAP